MYKTLKHKNIYTECPICTRVFQVTRNNLKYCSEECRKKSAQQRSRKHREEYKKIYSSSISAICKWCGRAFRKSKNAQKYCETCQEIRANGGFEAKKAKRKKYLTLDEILSKMEREGYRGTYGKYIAEGRDKL